MIMKNSDNRQMCDSKVINLFIINICRDIYIQTEYFKGEKMLSLGNANVKSSM